LAIDFGGWGTPALDRVGVMFIGTIFVAISGLTSHPANKESPAFEANQGSDTIGNRQERGKRQEARGKRQDARGKRQEARGKRQEARGKRQEAMGNGQ